MRVVLPKPDILSTLLSEHGGVFVLHAEGYACPYPQLLAGKAIERIGKGSRLEIVTDHPPSCVNVPHSLEARGQKVLGVEAIGPGLWKIVALKVV